jgi:hypothetical protein
LRNFDLGRSELLCPIQQHPPVDPVRVADVGSSAVFLVRETDYEIALPEHRSVSRILVDGLLLMLALQWQYQ